MLGVGVSCVDLPEALDRIEAWVETGERRYVCVTGMHGVMASRRDLALRDIHNDSGMTTPDGMPMVWAGRLAGHRGIRRVYGPDLLRAASRRAAERRWPVALVGGAPGVAERCAAALAAAAPGLEVAACESPPFRPATADEETALAARLNASGAVLVWVGLGTPAQERWMARLRPVLEAPVLVGVGAAFDIVAGDVPQAPLWMQRSGLEWSWRLALEPRRLWRRYLCNIPPFLAAVARDRPVLVPDRPGPGPPAGPGGTVG